MSAARSGTGSVVRPEAVQRALRGVGDLKADGVVRVPGIEVVDVRGAGWRRTPPCLPPPTSCLELALDELDPLELLSLLPQAASASASAAAPVAAAVLTVVLVIRRPPVRGRAAPVVLDPGLRRRKGGRFDARVALGTPDRLHRKRRYAHLPDRCNPRIYQRVRRNHLRLGTRAVFAGENPTRCLGGGMVGRRLALATRRGGPAVLARRRRPSPVTPGAVRTPRPERSRHVSVLAPAIVGVRSPTEMPTRKLATITGLLWIATFVTSIAAVLLYGPLLTNENFILGAGGGDTRIFVGATLEVLLIIANIGTAVLPYALFKRYNEKLAVGFVTARLVECGFIAVGIVSVLAIMTLRQDPAGASDDTLVALGQSLVAVHDATFLLGPGIVVGVGNGMILGYLMYRSGLMPDG